MSVLACYVPTPAFCYVIPLLPLRVLDYLNCFLKNDAIFQASIAFQGISPVV